MCYLKAIYTISNFINGFALFTHLWNSFNELMIPSRATVRSIENIQEQGTSERQCSVAWLERSDTVIV